MKLKKGDIIYFEWLDAVMGGAEWEDEGDVETFKKESGLVKQVGFYEGEDKDFIYTCARTIVAGGTQQGHLSKVPKGWIKELKKL